MKHGYRGKKLCNTGSRRLYSIGTGGQAPLTKCERGVRTIFGPNVERC